ncbi:LysR substrate-binding domain-containing protein [Streptacidiphilus monticola]
MELRQLEYFVAVAEEANFTRAAERVHISQSGVSAQIRALEHELGMPLIDRAARRAALTAAGSAALPHARAALAAADAVRKAVDEVAGVTRGALAVGMVSGCTVTPFFDALAAFHRAHPGVALRLFEDDSARLLAQVRSGRADLALVGLPDGVPGDLGGLAVTAERLVAAVPEDHPLARRQGTTLAELLSHPLVCMPPGTGIRAVLDRACAEQGCTRRSPWRRRLRRPSPTWPASGSGWASSRRAWSGPADGGADHRRHRTGRTRPRLVQGPQPRPGPAGAGAVPRLRQASGTLGRGRRGGVDGVELRRAKTAGLIAGVLAGTVALGGCQAAQVTRSQDGGPGAPVRVTGPYVALGDSYTAGPRIPDATGTPVGCLRSDANYPHLVAKALGLSGSTQFRDVSCSSARVADLTRPQKTADGTNPPQLDALNSATRLVTVGIGGNDVGFASLLGACVQAGLEYQLSAGGRNAAHGVAPCQAEYTSSGADEIAARITKAGGKVAALLAQVRERARTHGCSWSATPRSCPRATRAPAPGHWA